ncbi:MAG TPA: serine hydrolase domain-containing protein [Actinomycetota bacterium]
MSRFAQAVDEIAAETGFSGVVRVDLEDRVEFLKAFGLANRPLAVANTVDTRFGIASGTKGLTALTVMSLIGDATLGLDTTARSVLADDLRLIENEVTVEQLLGHRSGIGDYLDEDVEHDNRDYILPVPVHRLVSTEDYLQVLEGHPTKFRPGERFSYCNSGYVVLALIAERVSGTPFHDLVMKRVCEPAGMPDTAFLRSDELPERTAVGYLDVSGLRTNVLHLPVRGSGDGGLYSTVADIHSLWQALFAGRIVSAPFVDEMTRLRSDSPSGSMGYGLGFWVDPASGAVMLEGADAGVSFRTVCDSARRLTWTVLSNTTEGAWPMVRALNELLSG